jgi:hypothetical protein
MLYIMVYCMVYTIWYIPWYISRYISLSYDIYHGIYHGIYHMVYTIWYIPIAVWYIPSKSGIYHGATFQMTHAHTQWQIAPIASCSDLCVQAHTQNRQHTQVWPGLHTQDRSNRFEFEVCPSKSTHSAHTVHKQCTHRQGPPSSKHTGLHKHDQSKYVTVCPCTHSAHTGQAVHKQACTHRTKTQPPVWGGLKERAILPQSHLALTPSHLILKPLYLSSLQSPSE